MPSPEAQRAAHRARTARNQFYLALSDGPVYGLLRVQLELLKDADALEPKRRGPRPKRDTLLDMLDILEQGQLPIRTNAVGPVTRQVAEKMGLSRMQTRDLLHQLADMAEQLTLTASHSLGDAGKISR